MDWMFCKIGDLTQEAYHAIYRSLSPSRKAHIDRKRKEDDKKRSLLAAELVARLLKKRGVSGSLETGPEGKPFLKGCDLFVSITHSEELVACAVSRKPVGIDAEKIKPMRPELMQYACLPEEWQYVCQGKQISRLVEQEDVLRRFFEVWTAKEAFYKKNGAGNMLQTNTLALEKTHYASDGYLITIL